jgi:hypothetical protein
MERNEGELGEDREIERGRDRGRVKVEKKRTRG